MDESRYRLTDAEADGLRAYVDRLISGPVAELRERIVKLESALEGMLDEVNGTREWRSTTGMKTATDVSEFASVPPSGLKAIELVITRALGR